MAPANELAMLAGRVAAIEATNRTRSSVDQLDMLIAVADKLIDLLEGRAPATVGAAVTGFARGLVWSAEQEVKA